MAEEELVGPTVEEEDERYGVLQMMLTILAASR